MSKLAHEMQTQVDTGQVPGLVALAADGPDVEVVAVGRHDVESTAPMTRDTVFRVASITKPIVAAATMMLVDDGRLALDAEVRDWLPELAAPTVLRHWSGPLDDVVPVQRAILVEDLLTSRGGHGFPSDFGAPVVEVLLNRLHQGPPNPQRRQPADRWLAELATVPLLHQPGRGWTYNTGSDLLGVLLARVADRNLGDLLAERIFEPIGMSDTGFWVPGGSAGRLPSLYDTDAETGGLSLVDGPDGQWTSPPPFESGAGGLVSTVDDWYRFARLLLDDGVVGSRRLLTAESIDRMTTDHIGDRDRAPGGDVFLDGQGWGYGGGVDTHVTEPWQRPGRYGWVGGTGTSAYLHRPTRSVRIFLSQVLLGGPNSIDVMRAFWRVTAS
ncbi:MAG TPA: serine hydrolase [Pseudonocardia sp.]|nr:serine hydrolase [Pseudonocardia sp.]